MNIHPLRYYYCDDDGKAVRPCDEILADGYGFGDRMLEGVYFRLKWNEVEGCYKLLDTPSPGNEEYLMQLNMKYWAAMCEDYVKDCDVLGSIDDEEVVRGEYVNA